MIVLSESNESATELYVSRCIRPSPLPSSHYALSPRLYPPLLRRNRHSPRDLTIVRPKAD